MNKYNLSNIMKKAWNFFKKSNLSFAECLKMAWRNAKAIIIAMKKSNADEECHTWYNWKLLGKEVIHESKCLFQVIVEDITTKSGYRTLSYFGSSQVCELGSQE